MIYLARGRRHTYWHASRKPWEDHKNQALCGTQLAELHEERTVTSSAELTMELKETSVILCPRCNSLLPMGS